MKSMKNMRGRQAGHSFPTRLPSPIQQDLPLPGKASEHVSAIEVCAHHRVGSCRVCDTQMCDLALVEYRAVLGPQRFFPGVFAYDVRF